VLLTLPLSPLGFLCLTPAKRREKLLHFEENHIRQLVFQNEIPEAAKTSCTNVSK